VVRLRSGEGQTSANIVVLEIRKVGKHSASLTPAARRSRTSLTLIRMPRMQGRPPHWCGLNVMRSIAGEPNPATANRKGGAWSSQILLRTEPWFEAAQDDATRLAIGDMERAGIDIITDGEIRRECYSSQLATALSGIDLDHPRQCTGATAPPDTMPAAPCWGATQWQSSTAGCECTGSTGCGSSTPR
jgi:hypothetical protein